MVKTWQECVTLVDGSGWSPEWFNRPVLDRCGGVAFHQNVSISPSCMDKSIRQVQYNICDDQGFPILDCCYLRGSDLKVFNYVKIESTGEGVQPFKIEKPVVYLGWINPHYGHFLMESLCRMWVLNYLDKKITEDCFYYFDIHTPVESALSKKWILGILEKFGIDSRNLIFGDRKYVVEELIVPSQAMILHHSVVGVQQKYVWNVVANSYYQSNASYSCKKLYLSRSGLMRDKRKLLNELELEKALRDVGFDIVHPETLSFEQQIVLYANAELLIGPSGSALHNAAFMKEGSHVISLTTRDFCLLNELLCCYAKKVYYTLFICEGNSTVSWSVHVEKLCEYVSSFSEAGSHYRETSRILEFTS